MVVVVVEEVGKNNNINQEGAEPELQLLASLLSLLSLSHSVLLLYSRKMGGREGK